MSRTVVWGVAGAILLLATLWRVESLGRRPLWLDEISAAVVVEESPTLGALWAQGSTDEYLHPPLAYFGSWIASGAERSAIRLRLPSVVAGIASVALAIALGVRVLGARAGLLAGFLLAISLHHVDHSQEARPYVPSVALTLGLYAALFGYVATRRAWQLAVAVGCAAWALYTYHLALLHVAVAGGVAALDAIDAARDARRTGAPALATAWRRLRPFAIAAAALALLYLPQLPNLRGFLAGSGALPNHVLDLRPFVLHTIVDRWVSGPAWTALACEAAFAVGVVRMALRRDATGAGVLAWMAAPFLLFGLVPFTKYFDVRFLMASLPAFFLLVAAGVDGAARAIAQAAGRSSEAIAAAPVLAFAIALLLPAARLYERFRDAPRRCGDFVRDRALFTDNDRLCADHLLLNTIHVDHQFVLRKLGRFASIPPERLDGCVGRYQFPDGMPLVIERRDDQLVAQIGPRFSFALLAESESRFVSRIDARRIAFERGPDGRAVAAVLTTRAGSARAPRIGGTTSDPLGRSDGAAEARTRGILEADVQRDAEREDRGEVRDQR